MNARQKLNRNRKRANTRALKALFGIIVEGDTEKRYFDRFRGANVKVKVVPGRSAPDPESLTELADDVLDEFKRKGEIRSGDQMWIVSDKDTYTAEQIEVLFSWAAKRKDRGLGLSLPQFEYWLLLHYEDGVGVLTQRECLSRLHHHNPHYRKNDLSSVSFSEADINRAVQRARRFPPLPPTFREFLNSGLDRSAYTSVHVLVERLLKETAVAS
ncbi:hypothetical protein HMPREF1219_01932 [Corynebacterium pyruviciproducens ATCC BAA-1742]|uniref:RloB-like protein n=1 Tax=Corynebacterium pyruviciproducens ATCC BAA-1742 TaxID=1125779 RepID=S2YVB4_9CORY|nr:RloB family protein [Corynebacterium pyruviciproducens]EPD68286.1 hypothetical protein HMPREF1219_01932 [Corynebacterium pyruviciproducens ATCC BAA-1742]